MSTTPPAPARRAALAALLLLLVLAQTLGWMHRSWHGASGMAPPHTALAGEAVQSHRAAAAPWLHELFGHEAGSPDCQLLDILAQPGCAPAQAALAPVAVGAHVASAAPHDFVARWAALFDARGPPSSR